MPRFAILEHDFPALHWDLLLEDGSACRTWRIPVGSFVPTPLEEVGGQRPEESIGVHDSSPPHPNPLPPGGEGTGSGNDVANELCPPHEGGGIEAGAIPAEALSEHRLMYLDYEGPVSGNRGSVTRWDGGTFVWISALENRVAVRLQGGRWSGRLDLVRHPEGWRIRCRPGEMQQAGKPRPAV